MLHQLIGRNVTQDTENNGVIEVSHAFLHDSDLTALDISGSIGRECKIIVLEQTFAERCRSIQLLHNFDHLVHRYQERHTIERHETVISILGLTVDLHGQFRIHLFSSCTMDQKFDFIFMGQNYHLFTTPAINSIHGL